MRPGFIAGVLVLVVLGLVPAGAGATAQKGLVDGTVLDTTCAVGCEVECPPPPICRGGQVCAQRAASSIVCPLTQRGGAEPLFCTLAGCPGPPIVRYPPYTGTAGSVILRRAGSATVLRKLPVVEGSFSATLSPGRYVLRAHVAEPCWTGTRAVLEVTAGRTIPAILQVGDGCAAHPDS
jgi:hypothetical protein